ncbi:hypothetical protein UB45_01960 [Terrabacter sp. 28]|nr:hypothetical protein UB45_01960 [Terrabacter sp. 28]
MRELLLAVDREGAFKQLDWRSIPLGKRAMCWLLRKRYYFGAHLLLMARAQLDRIKMWRYAGEAVASEA